MTAYLLQLGVVTTAPIDGGRGGALVDAFDDLAPDWGPARWGSDEHLRDRRPGEAVFGDGAVDEEDCLVFWEGTADRAAAVVVRRSPADAGSSLHLRVRTSDPAKDGQRAVELLGALAGALDALYGVVHVFGPSESLFPAMPGVVVDEDDRCELELSVESLRMGLPTLWWANVFGAPYRSLIGDAALAAAPAEVSRALTGGAWYLQLTAEVTDPVERTAAWDRRRGAAEAALGAGLWWDRARYDEPAAVVPGLPTDEVPWGSAGAGSAGAGSDGTGPDSTGSDDAGLDGELVTLGPDGFTQDPATRRRWEPWARPDQPGTWVLRGVPAGAVADLLAALPEGNRTFEVNEIPSMEAMARLARAVPAARFDGQVVGPGAGTESVELHGVWVPAASAADPTLTVMAPTADEDRPDSGGRRLRWS